MNKKKSFIIIAIFWLVIFAGFIASKEFTLRTGNEVLLKTVPVDPRDLFRGDYVILRYDISNIPINKYNLNFANFESGDKIYVTLDVNKNGIGSIAKVSRVKPTNEIFMTGTVTDVLPSRLSVEYGIESYFVPEGRGREIERNIGKIYTKVAVDDYGNAVIKSLVFDGKEIDL